MSYKIGIVSSLQPKTGRVRVHFTDLGNVSYWLAVVMTKTHKDKNWWFPDVGDQVACLLDEHREEGCVIGAIYSTQDTPPASSPDITTTVFADGGHITHNRKTGEMTLEAKNKITLKVAGSTVIIDGTTITNTARESVTNATPQTNLTGSLLGGTQSTGTAVFSGSISTPKDMSAGGVSLKGHKHGGVKGGGDTTTKPV